MDDDQKFLFIFVSVILGFIVDIRLGLVLSCIIFGIFLIFFINNKMDNNKNRISQTVEYFQIPHSVPTKNLNNNNNNEIKHILEIQKKITNCIILKFQNNV